MICHAELAEITELIGYLDKAGEHGEPDLANESYGASSITLGDWFEMLRDEGGGFAQ